MSIPQPMPAATPSRRSPVDDATTNPANADMSIWPSMPMLMTPDRSQRIPQSAPSTSGVDCRSVAARTAVVCGCWNSAVNNVNATRKAAVANHQR